MKTIYFDMDGVLCDFNAHKVLQKLKDYKLHLVII